MSDVSGGFTPDSFHVTERVFAPATVLPAAGVTNSTSAIAEVINTASRIRNLINMAQAKWDRSRSRISSWAFCTEVQQATLVTDKLRIPPYGYINLNFRYGVWAFGSLPPCVAQRTCTHRDILTARPGSTYVHTTTSSSLLGRVEQGQRR